MPFEFGRLEVLYIIAGDAPDCFLIEIMYLSKHRVLDTAINKNPQTIGPNVHQTPRT